MFLCRSVGTYLEGSAGHAGHTTPTIITPDPLAGRLGIAAGSSTNTKLLWLQCLVLIIWNMLVLSETMPVVVIVSLYNTASTELQLIWTRQLFHFETQIIVKNEYFDVVPDKECWNTSSKTLWHWSDLTWTAVKHPNWGFSGVETSFN